MLLQCTVYNATEVVLTPAGYVFGILVYFTFNVSIKPQLNVEVCVDNVKTLCECLIMYSPVVWIIEDDFRKFPKLCLRLWLFNVFISVSFQTD